jgi:rfaE bifunctional protein nucleotidyltransferase chain/domain
MIWKEKAQKKIIAPKDLEQLVFSLRSSGHSIATINGSFDLMHAGHLHILFEGSQQADKLIVALNSDASVQSYKDPKRPIVSLPYRLEMMAALEFVSFVTWFEDTTPCNILKLICPDVHVNGAEYGPNCIESEVVKHMGARLHLVERIPSLSTTELITKIQAICV